MSSKKQAAKLRDQRASLQSPSSDLGEEAARERAEGQAQGLAGERKVAI